jgi:hypothetical protein
MWKDYLTTYETAVAAECIRLGYWPGWTATIHCPTHRPLPKPNITYAYYLDVASAYELRFLSKAQDQCPTCAQHIKDMRKAAQIVDDASRRDKIDELTRTHREHLIKNDNRLRGGQGAVLVPGTAVQGLYRRAASGLYREARSCLC